MKILKTTSFVVIQFLICSAIIEITCTFFLLNTTNPLYRARRILQYDQQLGWMQKPHLNTSFEHQPVNTDSNGFRIHDNIQASHARLLTLGPSSAFGWGVKDEETYTSKAAQALKLHSQNSSGIGHSIAQGLRVWDKIKNSVSPQYTLLAYGVNDLDKFRFFDSDSVNDREFFQSEPRALKIDKLQLPSDFVVVLSLVIRQVMHTVSCEQLIKSPQRVEWEDYKNQLNQMISEMRNKGVHPILLNTPFYLAHPNKIFKEKDINDLYAAVSELAKKDECKKAHEKLKMAKALEPYSINHKVLLFNENLKKFANENKVAVIDVHSLLINQNAKENFYDPVHPSAKGHKLIADEIVKLIQQKN